MEASLLIISEPLEPTTADASSSSAPVTGAAELELAVQQQHAEPSTLPPAAEDQLIGLSSTPQCTSAATNDPFAELFTSKKPHQEQAQQGQVQQHQDESVLEQQHGVLGRQRHVQQTQQQLEEQQRRSCANIVSPSLLPVCERVACLGQMLQQHGAAQGEANASIRLLLATISAKQVKTRQLLAGVSVFQQAAVSPEQLQQPNKQLQQQLADSQAELAASRSELAAAHAELSQLRAKEAQQAELLYLRQTELGELREIEHSYRAEISGLQEKLLEAQADLSRLSASLPGGKSRRRQIDGETAEQGDAEGLLQDEDGFTNSPFAPVAGTSNGSAFVAAADATAAVAAEGLRDGPDADAGFVTPAKPVRHRAPLLTPDQQNIQQLKNWLQQSQSALIKAQEDLLDSEAVVKQLRQKLEQQQGDQQLDDQQVALQQQLHVQQRMLEELQSSLAAAETAAKTARTDRDALTGEVRELRAELSRLSIEMQEAERARSAALQKLQAIEEAAAEDTTQDKHQNAQQPGAAVGDSGDAQQLGAAVGDSGNASSAAATAAAETAQQDARAAEAELAAAQTAAAAATAEVAALRQQLPHLQEQQTAAGGNEPVSQCAPADDMSDGRKEVTGLDTPYQQAVEKGVHAGAGAGERPTGNAAAGNYAPQASKEQQQHQPSSGSVEYDLLLAVTQNQALQLELTSTKQRLLLLLRLVQKAAAAATGKQKPQLPADLACMLQEAGAAAAADDVAMHTSNVTQSSTSSRDAAADTDEAADLAHLVSGLERRYCSRQQLQDLQLRGKEMQFLLENALEQVHLLKAGVGRDCRCPSEEEYQQLAAAKPASAAAVAVQLGTAVASQSTGAAGAGTSAVGAGTSSSKGVEGLLYEEQYTAFHDGHSSAAHNVRSHGSLQKDESATSYSLQHQQLALGSPAAPSFGSSCSSDVLRIGTTTALGTGLTTVDEGLGYDGLEGAWWNTSSIEPVTDLPDFLKPKEA